MYTLERQIAWLESASPDDWHRVVLDHNWGYEVDPLFWIVRQPSCDKATALTAFWLAEPLYRLWNVERNGGADNDPDPVWQMVKFIAERLNSDGYARSEIAFQASNLMRQDFVELEDIQERLEKSPLKAHPDMVRAIDGRVVENDLDFYRRYPEEFHFTVLIDLPTPTKH